MHSYDKNAKKGRLVSRAKSKTNLLAGGFKIVLARPIKEQLHVVHLSPNFPAHCTKPENQLESLWRRKEKKG